MSATLATALFMKVGRKSYPVTSLAEASAMFCKARDASHLGASGIDQPTLHDGAGKLVGYVSYNGRVWAGHPHDWKAGNVPAFDPVATVAS